MRAESFINHDPDGFDVIGMGVGCCWVEDGQVQGWLVTLYFLVLFTYSIVWGFLNMLIQGERLALSSVVLGQYFPFDCTDGFAWLAVDIWASNGCILPLFLSIIEISFEGKEERALYVVDIVCDPLFHISLQLLNALTCIHILLIFTLFKNRIEVLFLLSSLNIYKATTQGVRIGKLNSLLSFYFVMFEVVM